MMIEQFYFCSLMIASFGILVSSIEVLFQLRVFSSSGILSWKVSCLATKWLAVGPRSVIFHFLLNDLSFKVMIYLQALTSAGLLILSYFQVFSPILLFIELLCLILFSFRTLYGLDGSHHMNLVVIGSLYLASFFGIDSKIALYCIWFVSAQLILSYFVAGIKKLTSPTWRTGAALSFIFRTDAYGHPFIYKLIEKRVIIKFLMAWSVIIFETSFPLVLLNTPYLWIFLSIGILFHLINAIFMGLNNFFLAFLSAYPILLFSIQQTIFSEFFILFLFHSIFPLLLIAWLWDSKQTFKQALLKGCIITIYLINLSLLGFFPLVGLGHYSRYFLFFLLIPSMIKALYQATKSKKTAKESSKILRIGYTCLCILTGLMSVEIISAIKGRMIPTDAIELAFPMKDGLYYIAQGGDHRIINHHQVVSGQKYALDILKLNKFGLRSTSLLPLRLHEYCIFSTDVYSPTDGIVLKIEEKFKDLLPPHVDQVHPEGNHIIIRIGDTDKAVVLAHLQYESIRVREGDTVKKGQLLAKVGNSGNTSEPHLHIHCVKINDKEDFFFEAKSVPIIFNERFLVRNHVYSK